MEQYLNYYMEDEATSVAGDIGEFTPQMSKKPTKRKMEKKKKLTEQHLNEDPNMIEETTNYKFYNDGDRKVFEILDEQDFNMFYDGLRKANHRIWRQSETTVKMMQHMNENRGLWFEVRFGDRTYRPFDKTRQLR